MPDLVFDEFPAINGMFVVPASPRNIVVYRSASYKPSERTVPRYFASIEIARLYKTGQLYRCVLKPGIRLIDLRVLKYLLLEHVSNNNQTSYDKQRMRRHFAALGLISNKEQCEMVTDSSTCTSTSDKATPFQNMGSRLSIQEWDDELAAFLAEIFPQIDGYIAPQLWVERKQSYLHSEICLFNPSKSLKSCSVMTTTQAATTIDIKSLLVKQDVLRGMLIGGSNYTADELLERYMECLGQQPGTYNTTFTCELIKRVPALKCFMIDIFYKFTELIYDSLMRLEKQPQEAKLIISKMYGEQRIDVQQQGFHAFGQGFKGHINSYLVKPGMSITPEEIAAVLQTKGDIKTLCCKLHRYSLNQIMGAIYGAIVNHGVFYTIFFANRNPSSVPGKQNRFYDLLSKKLIPAIKEVFALSSDFDIDKLFEILVDNCPIGTDNCFNRGGNLNLLLDMMVYMDIDTECSSRSIVRKNMNNLEYVRTRVPKTTDPAKFRSVTEYNAMCPKFSEHHQNTTDLTYHEYLVNGDSWYRIEDESFYNKVTNNFKRVVKAGPSGSTFMWMNFVFVLLGIEKNHRNKTLLLLCIIVDFVPYFHSLNEVLFIFSRELCDEKSFYTLDQNPATWLVNYLGVDSNYGEITPNNIVGFIADMLKNK